MIIIPIDVLKFELFEFISTSDLIHLSSTCKYYEQLIIESKNKIPIYITKTPYQSSCHKKPLKFKAKHIMLAPCNLTMPDSENRSRPCFDPIPLDISHLSIDPFYLRYMNPINICIESPDEQKYTQLKHITTNTLISMSIKTLNQLESLHINQENRPILPWKKSFQHLLNLETLYVSVEILPVLNFPLQSQKLKTLTLNKCQIDDISFVDHCPQLHTLIIDKNLGSIDLTNLLKCTLLTHLQLGTLDTDHCEVLEQCKQLKSLTVRNFRSGHIDMSNLSVENFKFDGYTWSYYDRAWNIQLPKKLKTLNLIYAKFYGCVELALSGCNDLEELYIPELDYYYNVEFLKMFTKLKVLSIKHLYVSHLRTQWISTLEHLESLEIYWLSDDAAVTHETKLPRSLKSLTCNTHSLSGDLPPNLEILKLQWYCHKIPPILPSTIPVLYLEDYYNQVLPIQECTKLEELVLGDSYNLPLDQLNACKHTLRILKIGNAFNQSLEPLTDFIQLREIHLGSSFTQSLAPLYTCYNLEKITRGIFTNFEESLMLQKNLPYTKLTVQTQI
jgi:hypothetical protein